MSAPTKSATDEIKIEKDIAIPRGNGTYNDLRKLLGGMEVGDSIFIPAVRIPHSFIKQRQVASFIGASVLRHYSQNQFTSRTVYNDNGSDPHNREITGVRVWRIK